MNESQKLKQAYEATMIEDARANLKAQREINRKRQLALLDLDATPDDDMGIHIGDTHVSHQTSAPSAGKNWLAAILAALLAAAAGGGGYALSMLTQTQEVKPITLDVSWEVDEKGNKKIDVKEVSGERKGTAD